MWIRRGLGVTERSRRFLPGSAFLGDPSRDFPLCDSLFPLSADTPRRLSSLSALRLLALRSRDRPRRSSVLRLLLPDGLSLSLFAGLPPGDTDLRRVLERSLELDDDEDDDEDELDELEPELLRDDELDELGEGVWKTKQANKQTEKREVRMPGIVGKRIE